jgi:predicted secreted protein
MAPSQRMPSVDRLDERSKAQADKLDALEQRCAKIELKLDTIITTLNEARGGWRMLIVIAGVAGTAGAVLTKASAWLPTLFR